MCVNQVSSGMSSMGSNVAGPPRWLFIQKCSGPDRAASIDPTGAYAYAYAYAESMRRREREAMSKKMMEKAVMAAGAARHMRPNGSTPSRPETM
jgi:hypothetical protein